MSQISQLMKIQLFSRRGTFFLTALLLLSARPASSLTMELYTQVSGNSITHTPEVDEDPNTPFWSYPMMSQLQAGDFLRFEINFLSWISYGPCSTETVHYEVDFFEIFDGSNKYLGGDGAVWTDMKVAGDRRRFETLSGPVLFDLDVDISTVDFAGTLGLYGATHISGGVLNANVLGGRYFGGQLPGDCSTPVADPVTTSTLLLGSLAMIAVFHKGRNRAMSCS